MMTFLLFSIVALFFYIKYVHDSINRTISLNDLKLASWQLEMESNLAMAEGDIRMLDMRNELEAGMTSHEEWRVEFIAELREESPI